jgi:flagellar hook-associated protein 2
MASISSGVGLVSGIDYASLIDQLVKLESAQSDAITARNTTLTNQKTALTSLMANLSSVKLTTDALGKDTLYNTTSATSMDSSVISVTTTGTPASGTYQYTALSKAQNQQSLSSGYATTNSLVGQGTLDFRFGSVVDAALNLSDLNGGKGFTSGKIKITDRSGTSTVIDLTPARTIDDVLNAINNNGVADVTASVVGDSIRLTDNTGETSSNLKVQEVNSGKTAASLGLSGINSASDVATGSDIVYLSENLDLGALNDGIGLETTGSTALDDIKFTLSNGDTGTINLTGAKTLGDVVDKINAANSKLIASIGPEGDRLVISDSSGGTGTFTLSAENDSLALQDLGLSSTAIDGVITGGRIISGAKTVLLSDLNGGKGLGELGKINLTDRAGHMATIDLTQAETLDDVVGAINAAGSGGLKISAQVNDAGNGIELVDTSGQTAGHLKAENFDDGTTTATKIFGGPKDVAANSINSGDLKLKIIGLNTNLADLNGGSGIAQGKITITNSSGVTGTVNVSAAVKTIADLIKAINMSTAGVLAEINSTGDGIQIVDAKGGAGTLSVQENGSTTAASLNLLGSAVKNGSDQIIDGSMTRTIELSSADPKVISLTTKLSDLNGGAGVARGQFSITNSAGSSATVDLTNNAIQTVGDLVAAINSLSINVTAKINDTQDGIEIRDANNGSKQLTIKEAGSTTAKDLNILGTAVTVNDGGQKYQIIDGEHPPLTLQELCDKINNLNAGVTASIVQDGSDQPYRLSLASKSTGRKGSFLLDVSQTDMSFDQISEAQDALLGIGSSSSSSSKTVLVSSSNNTFSNVLSGALITIQNASSYPVAVTVSSNTTNLATQIQNLVNNYNSFRKTLNTNTAYDATTNTSAALTGDGYALQLDTRMSELASGRFTGNANVQSLGQLGISFNDDGTLSLNTTTLNKLLSTNLADVKEMFTKETIGVSARFAQAIDSMAGADNSLLESHNQALQDMIDKNQDRIDDWTKRLDAERTRLANQFVNLETTLAKMQNNYQALDSISWMLDSTTSDSSSLFDNSSSSS